MAMFAIKSALILKALAAHDNQIPFYAAVPSPTIDWEMSNHQDIEIEDRHGDEVATISGFGREMVVCKPCA